MAGLAIGSATAIWGVARLRTALSRRDERRALIALWLAGVRRRARARSAAAAAPDDRAVGDGGARGVRRVRAAGPGRSRVRRAARAARQRGSKTARAVASGALLSAGPRRSRPGRASACVARARARAAVPQPEPAPRSAARASRCRAARSSPDRTRVAVLDAGADRGVARSRAPPRAATARRDACPPRAAGVARALVLGDGDAVAEEDQARRARCGAAARVRGVRAARRDLGRARGGRAAARAAVLRAARAALRRAARGVRARAGRSRSPMRRFAGGAPSAWRAAITAALSLDAVRARPQAGRDRGQRARGGRARRARSARGDAAGVPALDRGDRGDPRRARRARAGPPRAGCARRARSARARGSRPRRSCWFCFGSAPLIGLLANVVLLPLGTLAAAARGRARAAVRADAVRRADRARVRARAARRFSSRVRAVRATRCRRSAGRRRTCRRAPCSGCAAAALLLGARRLRTRCAIALAAALLARGRSSCGCARVERPHGVAARAVRRCRPGRRRAGRPARRAADADRCAAAVRAAGPTRVAPRSCRCSRAQARARIDIAVLTHPHPDHYGGLQRAARRSADRRAVGHRARPRPSATSSRRRRSRAAGRSRARASARACAGPPSCAARPRRGRRAHPACSGPAPATESAYDANDNSLVLRIDYGRRSLLFAGDAEQRSRGGAAARRPATLRADVLKVAHHGSRTSSARRSCAPSPRASP